ncbi:hypothetical protein jhhlp_000805 [Lomentospora prolificans]|uniref:Transcription factor domain-containing protein n=1 Tax=Lomentospora prolificans TaxID=41688 RepID=A0A2N3NJG8_9PEZI|nr:hypothetical protein jhhlp_000805 [Lomentospora prolificans]
MHAGSVRAITLEELVRHIAKEPPNDGLGSRLLDVYFQQLHPRYPFLNLEGIWELQKNKMSLATAAQRLSDVPNNTQLAVFLFKRRRIESRIYHSISRTDKSLAMLRSKLEDLCNSLGSWKISLIESLPQDIHLLDYPLLHCHRAIRVLVQPFLTLLPPSDPYDALCLQAVGNICQSHKRLHQALDYGHSFIAVQTVFVAGFTLLYCGLWAQGHRVWSVTLADDIRACSLVLLFVMSERAAWVSKYRDAFEVLLNASMEKLRNGDARLSEMAAAFGSQRWKGKQKRCSSTESDSGIHQDRITPRQDPLPLGQCSGNGTGQPDEVEEDVGKVVMELAKWIDQDTGTTPFWMPNFKDLQNLSG